MIQAKGKSSWRKIKVSLRTHTYIHTTYMLEQLLTLFVINRHVCTLCLLYCVVLQSSMGKLNTMSKDGLIKGIKEVAMHHIEAYEQIDTLEEKERANVQRDYTEFIGHVARLGMFRCNDYYIRRDPSYVYTYVCMYV